MLSNKAYRPYFQNRQLGHYIVDGCPEKFFLQLLHRRVFAAYFGGFRVMPLRRHVSAQILLGHFEDSNDLYVSVFGSHVTSLLTAQMALSQRRLGTPYLSCERRASSSVSMKLNAFLTIPVKRVTVQGESAVRLVVSEYAVRPTFLNSPQDEALSE
jgi:hypothetical protein